MSPFLKSGPCKHYVELLFKSSSPITINGIRRHSTSTISSLNMLKKKLIKPRHTKKDKLDVTPNFAGRSKYYVPAITEWFNNAYTYNSNTSKILPVALKVTFKLVKSYFNIYSRKLENKIRSRPLRIRARRLSTNRMLISRPDLKHTNDKVLITTYVYNRQETYYLNKIWKIASVDNLDSFIPKIKKHWPSNIKIKAIREKTIKIRSKVEKHRNFALKILNVKDKNNHNLFNRYDIWNLKDYALKSFRKEILSVYFRQLISFNKSKLDERYLLPLAKLLRRIYNKEIQFNVVNLKYLYLNSHIFSETLTTKLSNRKNRLLSVLKKSLLMFKVPAMDRTAIYDEIYSRKKTLQNTSIDNIISDSLPLQLSDKRHLEELEENDILENSLCKTDQDNSRAKLKDYENYPLFRKNTILKLVKHKNVSGIRIEVAGRLTRRNKADRSVSKLKYKGNIRNMDSSYKGLPTVLLRGFAKSNLQYSNLNSKIRIGSFGLKGWVSSN